MGFDKDVLYGQVTASLATFARGVLLHQLLLEVLASSISYGLCP